jgi:hypothetical protein
VPAPHKFTVVAITLALAPAGCDRPAASPAAPVVCAAHTFPIAGACLADDDARAYCGKVARPVPGGCAPGSCPTGEPLDLASGECVPRLRLRKLGVAHKVALKEDTSLGCAKDGITLSVEGASFACLPQATQCGRGAHWSDASCHPDAACAPGSVPDASGACVIVLHRERDESVLDVGTWLRLVVGVDGGEGTAAICGPLVRRPWIAEVVAHGNATLDVEADLVFPNNDVSQARVTVHARRRFDPHSAEPLAMLAVTEHLEPVWKALRAVGGVASAASVSAEVHCPVSGGVDAIAVPALEKGDGDSDGGPHEESGKPPS